jgi:hypothetical protein
MLNLISRSLPNPVGVASQPRKQATLRPEAIPSATIPVPAARLR